MRSQPRASDRYSSNAIRDASSYVNTLKSETIYGNVHSQELTNGPEEKDNGETYYGPIYLNSQDGCFTHAESYDLWMTAADGRQYCLDICGNPIYKEGIYSGAGRTSDSSQTPLSNMVFAPLSSTQQTGTGGTGGTGSVDLTPLWAQIDKNTQATVENATIVNTAKADALAAVNTANNAQTTANEAKSTASTAQTTANEAKSAASTAQTTANEAQSAASTAQTTANEAKSTASTAQTNANEAKQAASVAQTTANEAKTSATNNAGDIASMMFGGAMMVTFQFSMQSSPDVRKVSGDITVDGDSIRPDNTTVLPITLHPPFYNAAGNEVTTVECQRADVQNGWSHTTVTIDLSKSTLEFTPNGDTIDLMINAPGQPPIVSFPNGSSHTILVKRESLVNLYSNVYELTNGLNTVRTTVNNIISGGTQTGLGGDVKIGSGYAVEYLNGYNPPTTTTNKLYPSGGKMHYNGSAISDVTMAEVDAKLAAKLDKSGGTMTGDFVISDSQPTLTFAHGAKAASFKYDTATDTDNLQVEVDGNLALVIGTTVTSVQSSGGLLVSGPASFAKGITMEASQGVEFEDGTNIPSVITNKLYPSGGKMYYNGNPISDVTMADVNAKLDKSGGTMTGALTISEPFAEMVLESTSIGNKKAVLRYGTSYQDGSTDNYLRLAVDGQTVMEAIYDAVNIMPSSGVWVSNLNVDGNANFNQGAIVKSGKAIVLENSASAPSSTTNALYSLNNKLYYNGTEVAIGGETAFNGSLNADLTISTSTPTITLHNTANSVNATMKFVDDTVDTFQLGVGANQVMLASDSLVQFPVSGGISVTGLSSLEKGVSINSGYAIEYVNGGGAPSNTTNKLYPKDNVMYYNGSPIFDRVIVMDLSASIDDVVADVSNLKTEVSTLKTSSMSDRGTITLFQYDVYQFTMQNSSSGYISGDYKKNNVNQPVSSVTINPPFYDNNGSVITEYPGCIQNVGDTSVVVVMDLTKPLHFTTPYSDTSGIIGTSTTGVQSTFAGGASVTLINRSSTLQSYHYEANGNIQPNVTAAKYQIGQTTGVAPLITQQFSLPSQTTSSELALENELLKERVSILESSLATLTQALIDSGLIE